MKTKSNLKKKITAEQHPDHSPEIPRVRKVLGQLEGIEKMITNRRYCPQILQQVQAAISALNSLKMEILKRHLSECLAESAQTGNYSRLVEQVLEIFQIQVRR
jgi:DNA-binding FrmR family transcriptional regulator